MFSTRRIYALSLTAFLLLSCSAEEGVDVQQDNQPPRQTQTAAKKGGQGTADSPQKGEYSVKLVPAEGYRTSVFRLAAHNFRLPEAEIQWMVNGSPVEGAQDVSFTPENARAGDLIRASVTKDQMEILSNTARVRNAPPEILSVRIMPEQFGPGDTLYVETSAKDVDGDEVTFLYEWTKNGESAGSGRNMESTIKRGDEISVSITPYDSYEYGSRVYVKTRVENMPPIIMQHDSSEFNGETYLYQVTAEDPDGDPLTYSLTSALDNMSIDPRTGLVTWNVPPEFTGTAPVTIAVSDGNKESTLEVTFSITNAVEEKE